MKDQARIWKYIFVIACVLALALTVFPGRMASYDEVFFKSAGRHWAATGSFAAPEIVGRLDVSPGLDVVYFAQPPLYSFVFGVYTRLVGFGPHRCVLFDALIHLLLAALTVGLARRVFGVPAAYAYAVGMLVLPIGTQGRPDELAMCFAIAGILCWTLDIRPVWRAVLSGVAFGLCGATSIGACLFLSPLALLVAHHRGVLTLRTASRAVISGLVVGMLCVAPILLHHPDAYRQLLAHGSEHLALENPAGQNRWMSAMHTYEDETLFALRFCGPIFAAATGSMLVIALCFLAVPTESSRVWKQSAAVALAAIVAMWLILPNRGGSYLWFFVPWLLALSAIMLVRSFPASTRELAPWSCL